MTTPTTQLEGFISKYTPELAAEGRSALRKLRRLVPGAGELVYDNYNFLVVGFCPSERPSISRTQRPPSSELTLPRISDAPHP